MKKGMKKRELPVERLRRKTRSAEAGPTPEQRRRVPSIYRKVLRICAKCAAAAEWFTEYSLRGEEVYLGASPAGQLWIREELQRLLRSAGLVTSFPQANNLAVILVSWNPLAHEVSE